MVASMVAQALRLQALRDLEILDSAAEERFDRLTTLAAAVFQAPIALISLALAFVATLYPSWRASRVNPAEALRYE